MASSKRYHKRTTKNRRNKRRSSSCAGGKYRRSSSKKNGTHKWHQKGCQSGGGSMTGGWPWGASDVQHIGGGGGIGGMSPVPQSINGNHYPLSTAMMSRPQNSNHLVLSGGRTRSRSRSRGRGRRHRKFIGEQHGGMAEYLPETVNTTLRGITETPASIVTALQGDSTAHVTSNPTVQPIAQPVQLK